MLAYKYKNTMVLKGVTLIEVLIIVAITGILSTITLVNFTSSRATQELEGSAREVAGVFRQAQNYALTGYQRTASEDPCRFEVWWSDATYQIIYWYKSGGVCDQRATLYTYTLRSGMSFVTPTGSLYFTLPHAAVHDGATGNLLSSNENRALILRKAGVFYAVCTKGSGLINHYAGVRCP